MSDRQMEGLPAVEQAKKAIIHTLRRIQEDPKVAFYLGLGAQTFALLTEAAATLDGSPVDETRQSWCPKKAVDMTRLPHAVRDFADNVRSHLVPGYGDCAVQFDTSFREMVEALDEIP